MGVLNRILYKPHSFAAREWLFQIHLWTGLLVGLYALLIGVTGSALVLAPQLRDWMDRDMTRVSGAGVRVSADQVLGAVRRAHPEFHVMSLRMPTAADGTFRVSTSHMGSHEYYVNPFNASIVGEGFPKKDLLAWLQQLHFNLLGGKTGRLVNGIGGLLMFLLCATGLIIWWPGIKNAKRAMSINMRARWKRVNYDVHSAVGFLALLFTVVISLTGAYYSWPDQTRSMLSWVSNLKPKAEPKLPTGRKGQNLPVDQLLKVAEGAVPGAWVSMVMLSHGAGQPVKVTLMGGGPREYQKSNYVYIDPYTADVVRVDSVVGRSFGDALLAWIGPLHFGTFGGGLTVYILWLLLGLSPAVLGVSGMLMWWNRVGVKKWNRSFRAQPNQPPSPGIPTSALPNTLAPEQRNANG